MQESIIHQFIKQTHSQKTQIKTPNVNPRTIGMPKAFRSLSVICLRAAMSTLYNRTIINPEKNQTGHGKNGNSEI